MTKQKTIRLVIILIILAFIAICKVNNTCFNTRYRYLSPKERTLVAMGLYDPSAHKDIVIAKPECISSAKVCNKNIIIADNSTKNNIPEGKGEFKSYMGYQAITCKSSKQYKLQQYAISDSNGLRIISNNETNESYYMIACGSAFGKVGDILEITLDNGYTFKAVKGDEKRDCDTDSTNKYCIHNGSVIEFIVDNSTLNSTAKKLGNVSCLGFEGCVTNINVVDNFM